MSVWRQLPSAMAFRRAGHDRVNAFEVGGTYMFKHYFEGEEIFDRLRGYYNNHQYRFEVPAGEFEGVREFLDDHGYGLVVVDATEEFAVVIRQYTAHPDNIFKGSVAQRRVDGYNCFLMVDREAAERAVEEGATRLADTELENPF